MKSKVADIRAKANMHKTKLGELNKEIDDLLLKYSNNKLGYKELSKQINKLIKAKSEVHKNILSNIKDLEEIECKLGDKQKEEPLRLIAGNLK